MLPCCASTQVKWGGTHRFHDAAAVEAKHRISLKSHGTKIRVRTDTETEMDLLSVTQEELVYDTVQELLDVVTVSEEMDPSLPTTEEATTAHESVSVTGVVTTANIVSRDHLVHEEVLVSWGELVNKFVHCFPSVGPHVDDGETLWEISQHCLHEINGERYHYWGTDSSYTHASRLGIRRRRDMIHVTGLEGNHTEIVYLDNYIR